MWNYEKRLQYPVKITQTNPKYISSFAMMLTAKKTDVKKQ